MVNFGLNSASILGIFLAVAGAGLYFLRSMRPELSRDHDIFFAAVGLLCGGILLWHGWRLDPILQFSQLLLAGSTIFFAIESIRLRGVATEQARRNTPIVDDERPPASRTRVYQEASLDELEPYEEDRYDNRRLRGYEEPRTTRRSYAASEEPRSSRSRSSYEKYGTRETPSRSRPRPTSRPPSRPPSQGYDDYWSEEQDNVEPTRSSAYSSSGTRSRSPRPESPPPPTTSSRKPKKRRPRPSTSVRDTREGDYVDYQPINKPEENRDLNEDRPTNRENPVNFDY